MYQTIKYAHAAQCLYCTNQLPMKMESVKDWFVQLINIQEYMLLIFSEHKLKNQFTGVI